MMNFQYIYEYKNISNKNINQILKKMLQTAPFFIFYSRIFFFLLDKARTKFTNSGTQKNYKTIDGF